MGSAPYLGGGFGHFYAYAPIKIEYAIDRFAMEVKRQLDVLDRRLADDEYLAGGDYTIADIAVVAVVRRAGEGVALRCRRVSLRCRTTRTCSAGPTPSPLRPAVQRGRMVNRTWGEPASQLHERHDASDFDTKTQDKIGEPAKV